jgi:hypothetical protein
MNKAVLRWQMEAQTAERRNTGRPLQKGDLVFDEHTGEYHRLIDAGSAGECLEAFALREIAKRQSERRDSNRD